MKPDFYLDRMPLAHMVASNLPKVIVIEDMDTRPGRGALVGKTQAQILKALGCRGVITNGAIRGVKEFQKLGMPAFARNLSVSHAYVHLIATETAGVNVSIPVFTGGLLSARQDEAYLRANSAQKALDDTETQVVSTEHAAWLDASTALKNISVTEALAASSDQALILAEAQYRAGQTSIIELSQAQLSDMQAEISAAAAEYDYEILRAALDFQVGTAQYETPTPASR